MEVEEAALCLFEMKHTKLDPEAAKELGNLVQRTESRMFFQSRSIPPRQMFRTFSPFPPPQIQPKNIENENENNNEDENRIESGNKNWVFEADPDFIQQLNRGEKILTRLPPLGEAIDGMILPRLPPIETLQGQIGLRSGPFEKQLTKSDLCETQLRLNFSMESVKNLMMEIMKDSEYADVIHKDHKGVKVAVYDRVGKAYEMIFVLWAEKMHVLRGEWKEFCRDHGLELQLDWITVWMFRHKETDKLCFAILPRRFPTKDLIGKPQKNGKKQKKKN